MIEYLDKKSGYYYTATVLLSDFGSEYEIEVKNVTCQRHEKEKHFSIDPEPWLIDIFADLAIEQHNSKKEDCSHRLGVK